MLGLEFQSQNPFQTWWLDIRKDYSTGSILDPIPAEDRERIEEICAAFEEAGWNIWRFGDKSDCTMWTISKHGTAPLFGGWTDEEAKKYMAEARKILRTKFGITRVPKHKLTLADMM